MQYEVELKFPLTDPTALRARLTQLGAVPRESIEQCDRYFNHPSRDFSVTDEAFRIRSVGTANFLTYKGPVLDRATKMRREIEIGTAAGSQAVEQLVEMWCELGFRFVREVRKTRLPWQLTWEQQSFELALDHVPPLGTFLEIELLVDENGRESARQAILELAAELRLTNPERRSYLELLLSNFESAV